MMAFFFRLKQNIKIKTIHKEDYEPAHSYSSHWLFIAYMHFIQMVLGTGYFSSGNFRIRVSSFPITVKEPVNDASCSEITEVTCCAFSSLPNPESLYHTTP
jgi:hypothetical protein